MTTGNRKLASADVGVIAMHIQHAHLGKRGVLDELYCNGRAMSSPELRFALTVFSLSSALVVLIGATRFPDRLPESFVADVFRGFDMWLGVPEGSMSLQEAFPAEAERKRLLAFPEDVRGRKVPLSGVEPSMWSPRGLFSLAYIPRVVELRHFYNGFRQSFPGVDRIATRAEIFAASACCSEWLFGREPTNPAERDRVGSTVERCLMTTLEHAVPIFQMELQ
jgi:hypothetical protein